MDAKKRKSEEMEKMNDSLHSLISNFEAIPKKSVDDIGSFLCEYLKTTEGLRNSLYEINLRTVTLEDEMKKLNGENKKNSDDIEGTVESIEVLDREVKKHGEEISEMKPVILQSEAGLHKLEQFRVDNDVFISGFPVKPNVEQVTTALATLFEVSENMIDYKYAYEFMPRKETAKKTSTPNQMKPKKVYHHMVISFKERATKMKFLQEKKKKGPLKYEQLCSVDTLDNLTEEQRVTTIRCTNRLSKFNLRAQYELLKAKSEGKLHVFQLHNGIMRIKRTENSPWEIVDTDEALKAFLSTEKTNNHEDFEDAIGNNEMSEY